MGLFNRKKRSERYPYDEPSSRQRQSNPSYTEVARKSPTEPPTSHRSVAHRLKAQPLPENDEFVIGLDFGTTFSGVAWAWSGRPDDIKIVTNWQSFEHLNTDKAKAPSAISYPLTRVSEWILDQQNDNDQTTWGYGIPSMEDSIRWFKLLLLDADDMDEETRDSPQLKRARGLLRLAGKTPTDVVADYLGFIWNHTLANIEKSKGKTALNGVRLRVVMTVPAVWTEKAIKRMKKAASAAGILEPRLAGDTTLHLVSEPEAAALATFEDIDAPRMNEGDVVVVCDAGGGTVDLISYKVHETKPLKLRECVAGEGKLCGAVFMDQDFKQFVKQLVGEEIWAKIKTESIEKMMNDEWENGIKRAFDGSDRTWRLTLPYEAARGSEPTIKLDRGHVAEIFDNIISKIRALVSNQVAKVEQKEGHLPKAVVLVGGFGSCQYLYQTLREQYDGTGIEILQSLGAKPWSAISRGAVAKGLADNNLPGATVESRISRASYGNCFSAEFSSRRHLEEDKFWDTVECCYRADNQMKWFLHKGDDIWDKEPVKHRYYETVEAVDEDTHQCATGIWKCELDQPPARKTEDVKRICRVKATMDVSSLAIKTNKNGEEYKKANYTLQMNVCGSALEFVILYQGQKLGQQSVDVDFE